MTTTDRRAYHRIPCLPSVCYVEADGCRAGCELLDESIGGFRISGIDPLMLNRDQPMLMEHRGEVVSVRCANVSRARNGKFSIGLQRNDTRNALVTDVWEAGESTWGERFQEEEEQPHVVSGSLINPYVQFGQRIGIVCRLLSVKSPVRLKIEVLSQKEFEVGTESVSAMTRDERAVELDDQESLDWLAGIYSAGRHVKIEPTIEALLDFEFGLSSSGV